MTGSDESEQHSLPPETWSANACRPGIGGSPLSRATPTIDTPLLDLVHPVHRPGDQLDVGLFLGGELLPEVGVYRLRDAAKSLRAKAWTQARPPRCARRRLGVQPLERGELGLGNAFGQSPLPVGEAALAAGVGPATATMSSSRKPGSRRCFT